MNRRRHMSFVLSRGNSTTVQTEGDNVFDFQERVQHLEKQLKEMERQKEKELNALRKEKRDLIHTNQAVRGIKICFLPFKFYFLELIQCQN